MSSREGREQPGRDLLASVHHPLLPCFRLRPSALPPSTQPPPPTQPPPQPPPPSPVQTELLCSDVAVTSPSQHQRGSGCFRDARIDKSSVVALRARKREAQAFSHGEGEGPPPSPSPSPSPSRAR
ncbi:uncharacterized protein LOC144212894 [Stigmatopora nigra]